jgi:biopolymer transport protein ExbD
MQTPVAIAAHCAGPKKNSGAFMPQLTSLIDVMTILLVFLIKSFSADATILTPSKDLELPLSSSKVTPKAAASIEIAKNAVLADGNAVAGFDALATNDSLVIPTLLDYLQGVQARASSENSSRELMIQSDKAVEFSIIKRVMYTCSRAGFTDFSILVIERG